MSEVDVGVLMDKISELEQRLEEYKQHSLNAEKMALKKLRAYPEYDGTLTPNEVLRRELLRHHTRTLLLDEIKQWIEELKGVRLYQLYSISGSEDERKQLYHQIRQYMTEKEAAEVNATYEANNERLRWKPIDPLDDDYDPEDDDYSYPSNVFTTTEVHPVRYNGTFICRASS